MTTDPDSSRYRRRIGVVLLVAAAYRLVFIFLFAMGPDEASYWTWSRQLDFGYVDHPPLVAWAIRGMAEICGDHFWSARLLACALAAGAAWNCFVVGTRLFNARVGFWSGTLYACCPMFSMAGGIMLLPEALLAFWMSLALRVAARIVTTGNCRWFYALGVLFGLALLSKYPGVLIVLALGLFALMSPRYRNWFRRPEPYLMTLIGLVMFVPVLVWNSRHDWVGLSFIAGRTEPTLVTPGIKLMLQSLAAQAGYHSPVIYAILLYGLVVSLVRFVRERNDAFGLLFCFSGPVIFAFLVVSSFRYTLPHWPAAGYVAAYIAGPAALLVRRRPADERESTGVVVALTTGAVVGAVASALMPLLLIRPLTTQFYDALQARLNLPEHITEPMAQNTGWETSIADHIRSIRDSVAEQTGQPPVVLTHDHLQASLLAHGLRNTCPVVSLHARSWQFDVWHEDAELIGRDVLFVSSTMSTHFDAAPGDYYQFASCAELAPLTIETHGVTINTVHFWLCDGYQGPVASADDADPLSATAH